MAAPLTKRQTSGHIDSIQTSKLIKKLEGHALEGVEMTASQVNAATVLLKKTLPDMKAVEHAVGDDTEMTVTIHKGNAPKPADD